MLLHLSCAACGLAKGSQMKIHRHMRRHPGRHLLSCWAPSVSTHAIPAPATTAMAAGSEPAILRAFIGGLQACSLAECRWRRARCGQGGPEWRMGRAAGPRGTMQSSACGMPRSAATSVSRASTSSCSWTALTRCAPAWAPFKNGVNPGARDPTYLTVCRFLGLVSAVYHHEQHFCMQK